MDKSKFYLNLSKCTEKQQRNIFKVLTENNQLLATQLHDIFYFRKYSEFNFYSLLFLNQWKTWQVTDKLHNLKELTYPEFIKLFEVDTCPKCRTKDFENCHSIKCPMRKEELFEGGEGENKGWIKIESEADLPKEDIVYWVVQNGEVVDMENWELTLNFHNKRGVTHYQPIIKPEPPKF